MDREIFASVSCGTIWRTQRFHGRVEIRGGDDWEKSLNTALSKSTVMLSIIGREWLTMPRPGKWGRRRIDYEDDWVRREIRTALQDRKILIPLYVDDAEKIVDLEALPEDIQRMIKAQEIELTENYWDQGLIELRKRIENYGFKATNSSFPMPERRKKVSSLSKARRLKIPDDLPGWSVTSTTFIPGDGEIEISRTELYRAYRFRSFPDATRFMAEVSPVIEKGKHHPRWEKIWRTVRVWLCTWDIEYQPSKYDLALAKKLNKAYAIFDGR